MLRIAFFGAPRFEVDRSTYSWSVRPKVLPLLAHLLLRPGVADRATLAFTLWPDEDEVTARGNLRRHIHYLQEALPESSAHRSWVIVDAARLRWNPQADYSFDVAEFDKLRAAGHLEEAASLYAGDLLPDVSEEWLIAERERLRTAHQDLLADLVVFERSRHNVAKGMGYARLLLAADPWREDAIRHIMLLQAEAGNRAGALKEYERFANALSAELDVEPMEQTTAVYDAIARGDELLGLEHGATEKIQPIGTTGLPVAPFVGREDELMALRGAWQRAARGAGALVLVGGEAGIGKSRLTREIAEYIAESGGRVFFGGTSRPESRPYQAPTEALAAAAVIAPHLDIEPIWLAALTQLVPPLSSGTHELAQPAELDQDRQRMRLFEAYAQYVQAAARRQPCCIVFEDLHWAGAATIELISYLARRLKGTAVLIIATYREEELERKHPLRELRRASQRDGYGAHLALARLSFDAVRDLVRLASAGEEGLAQRLFERTEGNPLYAVSLLDELTDIGVREADGRLTGASLDRVGIPAGIREAVNVRLARLNPNARAIADTASIAGKVFDVELLQEMTGLGEAVVLEGLGELIDRRIVTQRGGSTNWQHAFAHDLVHLAVYEGMDGARRSAQHKRMARVMHDLNEHALDEVADQIAHHWARGAEPAHAAVWLVRAARRAAGLYANREALARIEHALDLSQDEHVRYEAYLLCETIADRLGERDLQRRALDQLDALAPSQERADAHVEVLHRRMLLAGALADREEHARLAGRLYELAREHGFERWRVRALASTAALACATGDYTGARSAIDELVAHEEDPAFAECAIETWRIAADVSIFQGKIEEAQHALSKVAVLAESQANQGALARMYLGVARAALAKQNYQMMSAAAENALRLARTVGDRVCEAMALHTLANGSVYPFRIAYAQRFYEEALAIYEAIDQRMGVAGLLVDKGLFLTEIGLLDEALDLFKRADAAAVEIGYRWVLGVSAINSSYCMRLRGDLGAARDSAARAIAIAQELKSPQLQSAAFGNLGAAQLAAGDVDDAIGSLELGVQLRRPDGPTPRLGENLSHLAVAYSRAGRRAEALSAVQEVMGSYDVAPLMPPQPTEWLWNAAQVQSAEGNAEAAKSLVNRGAAVARKRAALIADEAIRRAFLALPFNRAVRQAAKKGAMLRRG